MNAPYGQPGGFGRPAGGPPPGFGGQGPRQPNAIAKIAASATAGLGFIVLIVSFFAGVKWQGPNATQTAMEEKTISFFQTSALPGIMFGAGLIALAVFLPKVSSAAIACFGMSVGGGFGLLFGLIASDIEATFGGTADMGAGAIMALIFGMLQMVTAIVYLLADAGIISSSGRSMYGAPGFGPQGYGPGGWGGPQGGPQGGPGGYGPQGYGAPGGQPGQGFGGPAGGQRMDGPTG